MSENIAQVETYSRRMTVLDCTEETAQVYGEIRNALRAKGRPIPENDLWIAAIAAQHQLPLVSRDAHFRDVAQLTLEIW